MPRHRTLLVKGNARVIGEYLLKLVVMPLQAIRRTLVRTSVGYTSATAVGRIGFEETSRADEENKQ